MAQRDAQKSEVHETTDDASTSPASSFERGAADRDIELTADPGGSTPQAAYPGEIGGGPGAGDGSSGGGAGAGIPGGGTDMRTNGAFDGGDVKEDRRKLFPEQGQVSRQGTPDHPRGELKGTHVTSDESDFGGPVRIEDNKIDNPRTTGGA